MKRIAVVSKNKSLARLLELEALSYRANCDVFLNIPTQIIEYSAVIVDTDTIEQTDLIPQNMRINVGNNDVSKQGCFASLPYPFLLDDLRDALIRCVENNKEIDGALEQKVAKTDENCFYLNGNGRTVLAFSQKMSLSEYELKILDRLCETPEIAVSRKELSELLGSYGDTNIADVYVCRLRKKFEKISDKKVIYTIRSKGYMTNFNLIK